MPDIAPDLLKENFGGRLVNWRNDRVKMETIFGAENVDFDRIPAVFIENKLCDESSMVKREKPDKAVCFHDQFVKLVVSEGCPYDCSFCSEKRAFPSFRSLPESELGVALRGLVEKTGNYDVVLLADCLGEYGKDSGSSFPQLIRHLKGIDSRLSFLLNNFNLVNFIPLSIRRIYKTQELVSVIFINSFFQLLYLALKRFYRLKQFFPVA